MNKQGLDVLMKKVADGDNEAFARLYDEVKKGVFAFAYSYLRCAADAEDVTEEVFFAVKRKAYLYRPGTDARAWIFQIAKKFITRRTAKAKTARGTAGRGGRAGRSAPFARAGSFDEVPRRNGTGNRVAARGMGI